MRTAAPAFTRLSGHNSHPPAFLPNVLGSLMFIPPASRQASPASTPILPNAAYFLRQPNARQWLARPRACRTDFVVAKLTCETDTPRAAVDFYKFKCLGRRRSILEIETTRRRDCIHPFATPSQKFFYQDRVDTRVLVG